MDGRKYVRTKSPYAIGHRPLRSRCPKRELKRSGAERQVGGVTVGEGQAADSGEDGGEVGGEFDILDLASGSGEEDEEEKDDEEEDEEEEE